LAEWSADIGGAPEALLVVGRVRSRGMDRRLRAGSSLGASGSTAMQTTNERSAFIAESVMLTARIGGRNLLLRLHPLTHRFRDTPHAP
jgi:hypothetical protein